MPRLDYSGDITYDSGTSKADAQSLLGTLIDYDRADNDISIDSISMRLSGDRTTIIVSLSSTGTLTEMETRADAIAQGATNIGMEPDVSTARASVEISGGVE